MLKSIIIEDEPNAAIMLEGMLHELFPDAEVLEKCRDLPGGVQSIRKHQPTIVFLDIELPVYSGIQLLEFFKPEEITFDIIFTTAYNQFAVNAFEMSAVDYLMKPIQVAKLRTAVEKAIQKSSKTAPELLPVLKQNLRSDAEKRIVVPVLNGFEILDARDIHYLKAEGSYTQIYNEKNLALTVSKNLKFFEAALSQTNSFIRIHRSYIANIRHARRIVRSDGGFLVMNNKVELPISDEKVDQLLSAIANQ